MEFEYWWLLAIPLAFGLGWVASRREGRLDERPATMGNAYFRGVNLLLNEQSDKAIDAFVDVVRIEPEASELHFALGSLFRRRGETDHAIRVHQNLVDRPDLDDRTRAHALYELGLDFLKAGLVDRAEDSFNRLQGTEYAEAASRQRLKIAQRSHDWEHVVDLARATPAEPGFDPKLIIAQASCELAMAALRARQFDKAHQFVLQAQQALPDHPCPLVVEGKIALAEGQPAAAIEAWTRLADKHPEQVERVVDHRAWTMGSPWPAAMRPPRRPPASAPPWACPTASSTSPSAPSRAASATESSSHSRSLNRNFFAFICSGKSIHVSCIRITNGIFKKVFGYVFCSQRVSRKEYVFCDIVLRDRKSVV